MTVIVDSVPILIADATISEGHRRSAKLTSHPREVGTDFADHYQPELPEVTAQLVFSATPLEIIASPGRSEAAYETLLRLQTERTLVTLVTTLGLYEGAALVELSAPRSATTGQAVIVDTTWRLAPVVSTQTVQIPAGILRGILRPSGQTKPTTKDQVSDPSAATVESAEAVKAKRSSLLFGLATASGAL
jgi:hypothetical protein